MQPYFFPYRNYYGLVGEADIFVFYDDIQFVRKFQNRNQIRTAGVKRNLTVPVLSARPNYQRIDEVKIDASQPWRLQHLRLLRQAYSKAPGFSAVWPWLDGFYLRSWRKLVDLSIASIVETSREIGLSQPRWLRSSSLGVPGIGRNERIIEICRELCATTYLCGPAAKCYLDVAAFSRFDITVRWHEPEFPPYPQFDGAFDHYVSVLDLLMNCGSGASQFMKPLC